MLLNWKFAFILIICICRAKSSTFDNCTDVTIYCLCGLPSEETIKTFVVHGEEGIEEGKPKCLYKPNMFGICASHSCTYFSLTPGIPNQYEDGNYESEQIVPAERSANKTFETECDLCDLPLLESLDIFDDDLEDWDECLSCEYPSTLEIAKKHNFNMPLVSSVLQISEDDGKWSEANLPEGMLPAKGKYSKENSEAISISSSVLPSELLDVFNKNIKQAEDSLLSKKQAVFETEKETKPINSSEESKFSYRKCKGSSCSILVSLLFSMTKDAFETNKSRFEVNLEEQASMLSDICVNQPCFSQLNLSQMSDESKNHQEAKHLEKTQSSTDICSNGSCTFLSSSSASHVFDEPTNRTSKIQGETVLQNSVLCANEFCFRLLNTKAIPKSSPEIRKRSSVKRSLYPVKYVLFPDGNVEKLPAHDRFRRFPKLCNDTLKPIKHAVVTCWFWPQYVTCNINCTHGHALEEDGKVIVSTRRSCRETDSYWSPKITFPVCLPFHHCKVYLTTPGHLACKTPRNAPPHCKISCLPYDENDEVPEKQYDCVDEHFEKTLPHCASLDKSGPLIKPPLFVRTG